MLRFNTAVAATFVCFRTVAVLATVAVGAVMSVAATPLGLGCRCCHTGQLFRY